MDQEIESLINHWTNGNLEHVVSVLENETRAFCVAFTFAMSDEIAKGRLHESDRRRLLHILCK